MLSPVSHAKHLRMNTPASFTGERSCQEARTRTRGSAACGWATPGRVGTAVSEARSLSWRRAPLPRGWPGGGRSASARWTPARHPCHSLPFRPRLRPCCPALSLTGRSAAARRPPAEPSRGPTGFTRRPGSPRCAHTETAERGECGTGPGHVTGSGRAAGWRPSGPPCALTWLPRSPGCRATRGRSPRTSRLIPRPRTISIEDTGHSRERKALTNCVPLPRPGGRTCRREAERRRQKATISLSAKAEGGWESNWRGWASAAPGRGPRVTLPPPLRVPHSARTVQGDPEHSPGHRGAGQQRPPKGT